MDLPVPDFSLIFFVMTFGVGYLTIYWAYSTANRSDDWNSLDLFDKTLQTFAIGATITFASLILLNIPFSVLTLEPASIEEWLLIFGERSLFLIPMEITLILLFKTLLGDYLKQKRKSYII